MKIVQKRINYKDIRNNNISNFKNKNINSLKKIKTKESNISIYNNNNIFDLLTKNKKEDKSKKVKISDISYYNKDKIEIIHSINNSLIKNPNKPKSLKKTPKNKLSGYNLSNYKKNISHKYSKSTFNYDNTENIKDKNNVKKCIKINYRNNINNYANYRTKYNINRNQNKIINKLNELNNKNKLKKNLINKNKANREKLGIVKIIEELKLNCNTNKNGLSKKFIDAQNNWRKNYFATVIQKIYRGYSVRKSDYKNKLKNKNLSSVYIRKRTKDNNYIFGATIQHRKCPTEENLNFICQNINKKNSDNLVSPPKIKEIVIVRNIKKDNINNPFKYSNFYFNNYIYNYNESFYQSNNNNIFNKIKNIFYKWKEYSDKKKILNFLTNIKMNNKKYYKYYSYEKKKENNYIDINSNFIKKLFI